MKIGVSQLIIPSEWSMQRFFEEAAGAGYEVVEVACRDEGELTPDTPDAAADDIAKRAADAGVGLSAMVHGHSRGQSNLLASGEAQRVGIEATKRALDRAARLGIDCTLHTLGSFSADLYYDEAYANGVAALKELAGTAEQLGVAVAVEFVWNGFLFSPMEMKRFLDEVGSPQIGFYFDPGNMAVFQLPQHWVRIVGKHIKRTHLKDWKGRALNGGWHPLLEGGVDFAAVMAELRAIGYDDALISEVSLSHASLADTVTAIRKIMAM